MRTLLFHIVALLVTGALYCVVVPQARADLFSDQPWSQKAEGIGIRMLCVYVCFLFVYFAVFKSREDKPDPMPAEGAYGGYAEADDEPEDEK